MIGTLNATSRFAGDARLRTGRWSLRTIVILTRRRDDGQRARWRDHIRLIRWLPTRLSSSLSHPTGRPINRISTSIVRRLNRSQRRLDFGVVVGSVVTEVVH